MAFEASLWGHKTYGLVTQTAGTVITRMIEPLKGGATIITAFEYFNQADSHTLTFLRGLGSTTITPAVASGSTIALAADPGVYLPASYWSTSNNPIAAGDYVVYRAADGTYRMTTVASGTYAALVLTDALPTGGVAAGAPLWYFGVPGDTNPSDAQAQPTMRVNPSASGIGVTTLPTKAGDSGLIQSFGFYEPLIIYSNNVTSQGWLNRVDVAYSNRLGPNVSNCAGTAGA